MLKILIELEPDLNPEVIISDFELASIKSFKKCFRGARVSGCLFHLGQNIQKKLKELGLTFLYLQDPIIRKFTKSLTSLAFVPTGSVFSCFNLLKLHRDFPVVLNELY